MFTILTFSQNFGFLFVSEGNCNYLSHNFDFFIKFASLHRKIYLFIIFNFKKKSAFFSCIWEFVVYISQFMRWNKKSSTFFLTILNFLLDFIWQFWVFCNSDYFSINYFFISHNSVFTCLFCQNKQKWNSQSQLFISWSFYFYISYFLYFIVHINYKI